MHMYGVKWWVSHLQSEYWLCSSFTAPSAAPLQRVEIRNLHIFPTVSREQAPCWVQMIPCSDIIIVGHKDCSNGIPFFTKHCACPHFIHFIKGHVPFISVKSGEMICDFNDIWDLLSGKLCNFDVIFFFFFFFLRLTFTVSSYINPQAVTFENLASRCINLPKWF